MKNRIQNLDPLRGFLALLVVLDHIPKISNTVGLPNYSGLGIFHSGYQAVLVFFSLSGYLIIGMLYDEKKKFGFISIKNFYIRRILRLYPVYYTVLFFGFFLYHYLLPKFNVPFEIKYNLYEGIALTVGFLPNVFFVLYGPGSILLVLWSIGIEEQFYLFIAPLLSFLPINRYLKFLLIFTVLYFTLFHLEVFSFLETFYFLYFFMSAGGVLAILERHGFTVHFRSFFLRICVYLLFIFYFSTELIQFDVRFVKNLFELILFNLLITNLANDDKLNIKSRLLNYIGKISYGIYMYHMIIITFVLFVFLKIQNRISLDNWVIILLINIFSILGTFLLAHLSFKYFESFFLTLKKRFRTNTKKM